MAEKESEGTKEAPEAATKGGGGGGTEETTAPTADVDKKEVTAENKAAAAVDSPADDTTKKEGGEIATEDIQPDAAAEATSPPATGDSSEEQRIRGGGKVVGDRGGGRNSRRHTPYRGKGGPPPVSDEDRSRRVYVGNLAWSVSWQDLKDHFRSIGHEVTRADVMMANGRSKGCGIVEYSTAEGAAQAVQTLNDTELHGRQIFVREDREERSGGGGGFNSYHHQPHGGGAATVPPVAAAAVPAGGPRFSSGEHSQSRRVYVGNLSWDVAWQDLKDHMREAGEVVRAEIISEPNGRSKGCGIVEYATEQEAQEAITRLTDTELKGRMIFVREDRENSGGANAGGGFYGGGGGGRSQNTSVYVWNLDYETTWQDLKDHARKAGNVDQATILTDPEGNSIGCGIVVYQRPQEAARAIRELQNSELNGRPMFLREDRAPSGRGYGGGGGRGDYHGGAGGHHQYAHATGEPGAQLYVGNLSFDTTWRDLKDHFKQCGDVERAEVMEGPDGKKRGFGTVRFFKKADAEAAIRRLNGVELQGRVLDVRLDNKAT